MFHAHSNNAANLACGEKQLIETLPGSPELAKRQEWKRVNGLGFRRVGEASEMQKVDEHAF
jgi:hypothetical protein